MKSFVVLGIGRFGGSLAKTLYRLGHEVLAVDDKEDVIQDISDDVTHAVVGDCTDEHTLRALGVRNYDVVIVSVGGDLQSSILSTVVLKDMGTKYVVAKAQSELHAKVLQKVGADRVVFPERDMGVRVANTLASQNFLDSIELSPEFSIAEMKTPSKWVGKSLQQLNVRSKYGITVLACKNEKGITISPSSDYSLEKDDILVIFGSREGLASIKD